MRWKGGNLLKRWKKGVDKSFIPTTMKATEEIRLQIRLPEELIMEMEHTRASLHDDFPWLCACKSFFIEGAVRKFLADLPEMLEEIGR